MAVSSTRGVRRLTGPPRQAETGREPASGSDGGRTVMQQRRFQRREVAGIATAVEVDPAGVVIGYADGRPVEPGWLELAQAAPLLAVAEPSKIVCVGLNYRRHAEEMGKGLPEVPLIFIKPSTAVVGPGGWIELPPSSAEVHFEGELAVVIGRRASRVAASDAMDHVAGFTLMNDVTARDIQRVENKYTRAKGFDTFAPLGPTLVSGLDPDELHLQTCVQGVVRQSSGCDDLIFKVPDLIAFISDVMTLLPGDVISTGTPAGVGRLEPGDVVEVSIPQIGTLLNPVRLR
jgi:2-keto-4-pentenoate hydratase/2-oxohepta-3-ene-1,7-dioic acid hydratase in catechol pathway